MKRSTFLAMAAAMSVGFTVPALADYVHLGSVDVSHRADRDTAYSRFGGPVESLRFSVDRSSIFCRSIRVHYADGQVDEVFSGHLLEGRTVDVDVPGRARRIDSISFACRSEDRSGGQIEISAEVGRYRSDWQRSPDWSRMWASMFGMGSDMDHGDHHDMNGQGMGGPNMMGPGMHGPDRDGWISLGRESFEGRDDTESTFAGWRGRSVDRIGLRPLDAVATCSRITATFDDGYTRDLSLNRGNRIEQGRVTVLDLPGRERNLSSLNFRCHAVHDSRVTIEVLVR